MTMKKGRPGGGTPKRPANKHKITPSSTYPHRKSTMQPRRFQARSNADALAAESAYLLERNGIHHRVKEDQNLYMYLLEDIRIMVGADV